MASRLTRQRAMRRAWRGRSSRADLRAWSLRLRRSALTRPSDGGAGAAWAGAPATGSNGIGPKKRMRGGYFAYLTRGWRSSGKSSAYRRAGRRSLLRRPFDDLPLGHRTRRCHLHHKAPRRDDNKAAHGGFGGPEDAQHSVVNGGRNPRNRGIAPAWRKGPRLSLRVLRCCV